MSPQRSTLVVHPLRRAVPRISVAMSCAATVFIPWLGDDRDGWEWTIAVAAGIAAVSLFISAFMPNLPPLLVDPAALLAALVLLADGLERLLDHDEWDAAVRSALLTFAAAILALALAAVERLRYEAYRRGERVIWSKELDG